MALKSAMIRQVQGEQLELAAVEWLHYLQNYDQISGIFDKYSPGDGFLDKEGLRKVRMEYMYTSSMRNSTCIRLMPNCCGRIRVAWRILSRHHVMPVLTRHHLCIFRISRERNNPPALFAFA